MFASERLTHAFAWLVAAVLRGWSLRITLIGKALGTSEWLISVLEIVGAVAFFGRFGLALCELTRSFSSGRGWPAMLGNALLTRAALAVFWVALAFHLIGFCAQYLLSQIRAAAAYGVIRAQHE